jgi:DNA mismatch endonuclease (patch repair protein)
LAKGRVKKLTAALRKQMMQRFKKTDTKPELAVRKIVASYGYQYQKYGAHLPGNPDLVYEAKRKVIFVHGRFWHQHTGCSFARTPKTNQTYWLPKLSGNKRRDALHKRKLRRLGWNYLVIWECEIAKVDRLSQIIATFLKQ